MKHVSAITTALIITAVIGLGIAVIGVSAFTNKNTVPLQNSPNSSLRSGTSSTSGANSATTTGSTPVNVQQLQNEVSQLQSQLSQENQVISQYQSLLSALQQRGVISIDQNGNVYINRGGEDSLFH